MQIHNEGLVVLNRKEKHRSIYVELFKKKVYRRNENAIIAIVGKTGSGKSYTALSLAEQFEGFKHENMCFTAKEFFSLINSNKLSKGSVILFDESEVDLDNLTFWDKIARYFAYLMATVRYRNYIIIFTMPYKNDVIKKVRNLVHYTVECTGAKNYNQGYSLVKIFENSANYRTGEVYDKYLRVVQGGKLYKIKYLKVHLPSKETIDYYEFRKHEYVSQLYARMEKDIIAEDDRILNTELTPKQEIIYSTLLKYPKTTLKEIAVHMKEDYGLTWNEQSISLVKKAILKKGYTLDPKPADFMEKVESRAIRSASTLLGDGVPTVDIE